MESTKAQTIRYLQDLHAAEKLTEDILDKLADDAEAVATVRTVAAEGVRESTMRRETLEARVRSLDGNLSSLKDFANSTMGVLSDIFNSGHNRADKITMDTIKAHAALHMLHGSYCALSEFATAVNDPDTQQIAERYMEEAMASADRLMPAIRASARAAVSIPA